MTTFSLLFWRVITRQTKPHGSMPQRRPVTNRLQIKKQIPLQVDRPKSSGTTRGRYNHQGAAWWQHHQKKRVNFWDRSDKGFIGNFD